MRHCLIVFLFIGCIASAQNKRDIAHKSFITPISQPFGNVATAKIDNKGGKLKSADGGLEVIIPENALDAETIISIQSTHNELNENDEGAYQLEPSGIIFKNPVQLIFHYSDENADIKSIGWQDDKGQWHQLKKIVTDTVQKTITALASHFSKWAKFARMYIDPGAASVKVNKLIRLRIKVYPEKTTAADDNDLLAAPLPANPDDDLLETPENGFHSADWAANGFVNGNSETGVVSKQNNIDAVYKAPAVVPSGNPVAVSVQIYSNKKNKKLLLTSNITVVGDQYHFTYIHIDEAGCYFTVDSSSCIFIIEKDKVKISNIINYKPWSDWPDCGGCHYDWNKAAFKGLAEITGIASSMITPPKDKSGPANVNINFLPAMGNTPGATVHCKKMDSSIPSVPMPAVPTSINFDIDGDDIVIHYAGKTGRNELVIEDKNEKTMIYIYKLNN